MSESDATHPEPPPDAGAPDEARAALVWCGDNPTHDDALPLLNELRDQLLRPELATQVVTTSEAVTRRVLEDPAPGPAFQAHMIILLSYLLRIESQSTRVDSLFAAWLRHPASYGPGRQTPPAFQRQEFVQRLADLLGWGTLDVKRDHDGLGRFLAWVNSWALRNRYRVRRTLDTMRRNFPAPDLWNRVHFK